MSTIDRVIKSVSFPGDFSRAFDRLIAQRGIGQSQAIKGALLQAEQEHFVVTLGHERYVELIKDVIQGKGEE